MKPFDLEAAKRGEPVETVVDGQRVNFIGTSSYGAIVFEFEGGQVGVLGAAALCMGPKVRKVTVQLWRNVNRGYFTVMNVDGCALREDIPSTSTKLAEWVYEEKIE